MTTNQLRPPWYRRLSLQVAVLCTIGILLFNFFEPYLYDFALEVFDLPPLDVEEVWIVDEEMPEPSPDDPDFDEYEDLPEDAVVMTEKEFQFEQKLQLVVFILVRLLTLGMIALLISFVVTTRITRLSRQANEPVAPGELPGPFTSRGGDEIALLAARMNDMRKRVAELLADMAGKDRSHREWVAQVSHDLRTPLTALVACLERAEAMLTERGDEALQRELGDVLSIARTDVDRVHTLAEDLFDVARLDAKPEINHEPIPPGELLRHAVRSLEPLAKTQGIEIELEVAPQLPNFDGDGHLLLRATENLLRNALQHAQSKIAATATAMNGSLLLTVEDDGPGFGSEDSPARSRADSAGLGLHVAQRVAEAHSGKLDTTEQSSLGGARVAIVLPLDAT